MTPKEVLYLDDALARAQFFTARCREAANQLQDEQLRQTVRSMADTGCRVYSQFYNVI